MSLRILIVDDEAPARAELRWALERLDPALQLDEAENAARALARLREDPYDAVFLDVEMPGLGGVELAAALRELERPPLVVFATAYAHHAPRAFDLEALDYLVKPFDEARVARTLARLHKALDRRRSGPVRVWAEAENENLRPLNPAEILWFEAADKRVWAVTSGERLLVRETLAELEARGLPHFVRTHKTYLTNLDHVVEVVPWFSGNYRLRMTNGRTVKLSRRHAAGFWKAGGNPRV